MLLSSRIFFIMGLSFDVLLFEQFEYIVFFWLGSGACFSCLLIGVLNEKSFFGGMLNVLESSL